MKKNELKVIFRKENEGNIIAFMPQLPANFNNMLTFTHNEGHNEASLEYYKKKTKKALQNEYAATLNSIKNIYTDYKIIVREKLNYKDLY